MFGLCIDVKMTNGASPFNQRSVFDAGVRINDFRFERFREAYGFATDRAGDSGSTAGRPLFGLPTPRNLCGRRSGDPLCRLDSRPPRIDRDKSLDEFIEGREFKVNLSPPDLISGRDVVRRARQSRLQTPRRPWRKHTQIAAADLE
jgi:hypothetical protein